ncbi:MAG: efflux RND transporter periplasmic adaptor subunit [Janthinobacterium lividum]
MHVDRIEFRLLGTVLAVAVVTLAACGKTQAPPPAQAPQVGVITVQRVPVAVTTELPGRTSAFLVSQVRARVDGIVLKRNFTEGTDVKRGQLLYTIDPAPYQAQLASAQATLARANANVTSAAAQAARYKTLVAANAISKQDYDNAVAALGSANADIAAGKAAVRTAQINLGYTTVTSSISGRIGASQVTEGAYVQASQATLLATVQQLDPIYVDVTQSSSDLLRLRRELQAGELQSAGANTAKVTLVLDDNTTYPETGTLQFSDVTVDQTTGTVTLRAVFPNPRHDLLPGMFVRAHLQEAVNNQAMLVPQTGVSRDQRGNPTALVVGPDNKVKLVSLQSTRTEGDNWVVTGGLNPGDKVIVQGVQKAHPGATVTPVAAQIAPLPPGSPYATTPTGGGTSAAPAGPVANASASAATPGADAASTPAATPASAAMSASGSASSSQAR